MHHIENYSKIFHKFYCKKNKIEAIFKGLIHKNSGCDFVHTVL